MYPRRNWDSPNPSLASKCAPPPRTWGGGGHTCPRVRGWGSPNSDDLRKSLALCLLCSWNSRYSSRCLTDFPVGLEPWCPPCWWAPPPPGCRPALSPRSPPPPPRAPCGSRALWVRSAWAATPYWASSLMFYCSWFLHWGSADALQKDSSPGPTV